MPRPARKIDASISELLKDTATGKAIPFLGIRAEAVIDAASTQVTVTQRYKNRGKSAVETAYTFPLPEKAVLLSFQARIGKKVIDGRIEKKEEAAAVYEKAIQKGNTAALVEQIGEGLMTAHLGNLPAGEEAVLTLVWVEANTWRDGEMRWTLPTCVAPAYGQNNFEPQNEPVTNPDVLNNAEVSIRITEELGDADISCPSHRFDEARDNGAILLSTRRKKIAMDRDVIVKIRAKADIEILRAARHGGTTAILASFIPAWKKQEKGGRNIKIVLDCSGSMGGASIETARQTVGAVLDEIGPKDEFNLIRFGCRAESIFPRQMPGTGKYIRMAEKCVRQIDADMGGTEIESALEKAFDSASDSERPGTVILITDGQVYQMDRIVARAAESGHRIFCIGVGSCVNHALLDGLAEESGGAAEFVAPGEEVGRSIRRQFARVRSGSQGGLSIKWPGKPLHTTSPATSVFSGDAIHAAALYGRAPKGSVVFSWKKAGGASAKVEAVIGATSESPSLVRVAAGRILAEIVRHHNMATNESKKTAIKKDGEDLAMTHGLISPWTSFILVSKNKKKAKGEPAFHKISQMTPAGWNMFAANAPSPLGGILRGGPVRIMSMASGFGNGALSYAGESLPGARRMGAMQAWGAIQSSGHEDVSAPGVTGTWNTAPSLQTEAAPLIPRSEEEAVAAFLSKIDDALMNGEEAKSLRHLQKLQAPASIIHRVRLLIQSGHDEAEAVRRTLLELATLWPSLISMASRLHLAEAA